MTITARSFAVALIAAAGIAVALTPQRAAPGTQEKPQVGVARADRLQLSIATNYRY